MSTHTIENREKNIRLVVGYDPGMNTFYGQIWDLAAVEKNDRSARPADLAPILWIGTDYDEILSTEALRQQLGDYAAHFTSELEAQLKSDRDREFHEPTPLQKQMRNLFGRD